MMIYNAYLYKNLLSAYTNDRGLDFTLVKNNWNKGKILKKFLVSFYNVTNILSSVYYLTSYSFLQQTYFISQKFIQRRYNDILELTIYEIKSK